MHYVFTDIHGDMNSWLAVKEQFGQPENTLVFLGDACDRGNFGYEIMKDMIATQNLVYIKGNHEDMFVKSAKAIKKWTRENMMSTEEVKLLGTYEVCPNDENVDIHNYNGGTNTISAWIQDGMPMNIVEKINNLCYWHSEGKYDMCHAGCSALIWKIFSEEFEEECLWDREHLNEDWKDGRILIHGHTPTTSGLFRFVADTNHKRKHIPIQYANDTKINLDTRSIEVDFLWVYCLETKEFIKVEKKNEA